MQNNKKKHLFNFTFNLTDVKRSLDEEMTCCDFSEKLSQARVDLMKQIDVSIFPIYVML